MTKSCGKVCIDSLQHTHSSYLIYLFEVVKQCICIYIYSQHACEAVAFCVLPLISINQNLSILTPIQFVCNTCCWLNNQLHLKQATGTTIRVHYNSVFCTYCLDLLEIVACSRASAVGCGGLAVKQPSSHHKTQEPFKITAPTKTALCMDSGSKGAEGAAASPLIRHNKNHQVIKTVYVLPLCYWGIYGYIVPLKILFNLHKSFKHTVCFQLEVYVFTMRETK